MLLSSFSRYPLNLTVKVQSFGLMLNAIRWMRHNLFCAYSFLLVILSAHCLTPFPHVPYARPSLYPLSVRATIVQWLALRRFAMCYPSPALFTIRCGVFLLSKSPLLCGYVCDIFRLDFSSHLWPPFKQLDPTFSYFRYQDNSQANDIFTSADILSTLLDSSLLQRYTETVHRMTIKRHLLICISIRI
jgi:hypothetical protein